MNYYKHNSPVKESIFDRIMNKVEEDDGKQVKQVYIPSLDYSFKPIIFKFREKEQTEEEEDPFFDKCAHETPEREDFMYSIRRMKEE